MGAWHRVIEAGDEVIVNGKILYVEKKAKRKWYWPVNRRQWWCYDDSGEDVLVSESDLLGQSEER